MTTRLLTEQPAAAAEVMDSSPTAATLVVGIDGSGCARRAARWAAAEAVRDNAQLRLLHAVSLPPAGFPGYKPYRARMLPELVEDGKALLRDIADKLGSEFPGLQISTEQAYGEAAKMLRRASRNAKLTVVGSHGTNRVAVALGSVAADIAATNPVPVAVIHPHEPPACGPVVVGINDSSADAAVLEFAFEAATGRGAALTVVSCSIKPVTSYLDMITVDPPVPEPERKMVTRRIADVSKQYLNVPAHLVMLQDRPASALLDYAQFAQLLVVGSRGHGGIGGILVGSVSHELITYSTAPLVIVRSAA